MIVHSCRQITVVINRIFVTNLIYLNVYRIDKSVLFQCPCRQANSLFGASWGKWGETRLTCISNFIVLQAYFHILCRGHSQIFQNLTFLHLFVALLQEAHFAEGIKGIFSDFHNIFFMHKSEDINKKSLFPNFQLIPILCFQVMHDYVCFIAPILDYCVE